MLRQSRISHALAASAIALTFSISAHAGATRTFVATTGDDANTATGCGAAAPCRSFTGALSVTNPGGEVVVLNSGGYGPATISQPVIITAIGVDASVSVTTSGGMGLIIDTAGAVTINGLNLHGEATGSYGVYVEEAAFLRLYNLLIENFTNNGVQFDDVGKLEVYDSTINDNAQFGIFVGNPSSSVYVDGTSFNHNFNAFAVTSGGQATVADSSVSQSTNVAFIATDAGSLLTLFNDRVVFNQTALSANSNGALYFSNCVISNNTNAYNISSATITGTNPGTSLITPGQATTGTLSTSITLQ